MTLLTNRAILLAKLEGVFRTDSVPVETLRTSAVINSTDDIEDSNETIDWVAHGFTTGTGPLQATLVSGAFPTNIAADTDYWAIEGATADLLQLATSRALALAGTAIDLTDQVGTFTLALVQSDAFNVIAPEFAPDITVLDREVVQPHLSSIAGATGQKVGVVTFQTEIKNNGVTDGTKRPALGTLLRGCGMAELKYGEAGNTEETILDDTVIPINAPTGAFTYTKTTGYAGDLPRVVVMECTTGGASATAEFTLYSPAVGDDPAITVAAAVMTDSAAYNLVESAQITPTIQTSFALGDTFVINLAPAGHTYSPVSSAMESLSLYVYYDGLRHRVTGARGTYTAEGEANSYGTFSWTFTGDFQSATDTALPTNPVFEATLPEQVQLAALGVLGGLDFDTDAPVGFTLAAQSFSLDIGNNVVVRDSINESNSMAGAIISDRAATGSFNPEAELEATHPAWAALENATRFFFNVRQGSTQGNCVVFSAPYAQYTGLAYSDRNNIRALDVTMRLAAHSTGGNDELRITFC